MFRVLVLHQSQGLTLETTFTKQPKQQEINANWRPEGKSGTEVREGPTGAFRSLRHLWEQNAFKFYSEKNLHTI